MAKKNIKKTAEGSKDFLAVNKFLKIIADENRLKILVLLEQGSMNVTEIHSKLKLPQNLTSHHISKLKSGELLLEKREGTFRNYSLNVKQLRECNKMLKDLLKI